MKKIELGEPINVVRLSTFEDFIAFLENNTEAGYVLAIDKDLKTPYFVLLDEESTAPSGYYVCVCNHILNAAELEVQLRFENIIELQQLFREFHVFSVSNNEIVNYLLYKS